MPKIGRLKYILQSEAGISLVELAVVIVIIVIFTAIVISNFPSIQKQFALSEATYKFAQDLRKTEDLGLSGVATYDKFGTKINVKGYGVYINLGTSTKQYIIYADLDGDHVYDDAGIHNCVAYGISQPYNCCSQDTVPSTDCVVEVIDVSRIHPSLFINNLNNISTNSTSINFTPPDPTTTIANIVSGGSPMGIVVSNGLSTRTVLVNTSGLINVQ